MSLILVDAGTPGLEARKLKKLGWHSSDTAELFLENVRVPVSHLVGEENQGFYSIMQTFVMERLTVAATSLGTATLALADTLAYMQSRQAFGRPIVKFQALRHRLADLFTELEAARQLTYHAAWLHEQREPAVRESSMAKLLASELSKKVMDECLQFHGGFGYVEEYPIARAYRDARVGTIVAGTSEIMREIISRSDLDGVEFGTPDAPDTPSSDKAAPVGGVAELLRSLPSRLRPEKVQDWSGVFHFAFKDSAHPEWTVRIDSGRCEVEAGLHGKADCLVRATEAVYIAIEQGKQKPELALMTGKLKISNLPAMMRFSKAFRRP